MRGRHSARITSNAVTQVSGNKVHVGRLIVSNNDSAIRFLQLFNALSANIVLGTTVPVASIQFAANTPLSLNMGDAEFATGFSYAVTTTELGSTGPTSVWVTTVFK